MIFYLTRDDTDDGDYLLWGVANRNRKPKKMPEGFFDSRKCETISIPVRSAPPVELQRGECIKLPDDLGATSSARMPEACMKEEVEQRRCEARIRNKVKAIDVFAEDYA